MRSNLYASRFATECRLARAAIAEYRAQAKLSSLRVQECAAATRLVVAESRKLLIELDQRLV